MKLYRLFIYLIISFSASLFLLSCGNRNDALLSDLEAIKREGDSVPETALKKLGHLSGRIKGESEYVQMKYDLLKIRLQDKSDIVPENDKTAKRVYDYFQKNGNDNEKAEAAYYLASVYRDLHDSPRAVSFFLQSEDLFSRCEKPDSILWANTYSQLTGCYEKQYNDSAALNVAIKQLEFARKNRTLLDPTRIMDAATCYRNIGDTLNAIRYQDWALEEITKTHSEEKYSDILAELTRVYIDQGNKEKAVYCKNKLAALPKESLPDNYLANIGEYYRRSGQLDSANICLTYVSENSINPLNKNYANYKLLTVALLKNDNESIKKYARAYIKSEEESEQFTKREISLNARNEYIYHRDKEQETKAYQAAENAKRNLVIAFLGFISIVAIFIIIFQWYRLNSLKKINRQKEIIKNKNTEIRDKAELIEEQSQQLQEKDEMLKEKAIQNETLYQVAYTKKLKENGGEIIEKFLLASEGKDKVNDEDWQSLFSAIDGLHPDFRHAVLERIKKPTEDIIRIAYLLKAGMTNPQIIAVTDYSKSSVYRKSDSIRKALPDFLREEEEENIN